MFAAFTKQKIGHSVASGQCGSLIFDLSNGANWRAVCVRSGLDDNQS